MKTNLLEFSQPTSDVSRRTFSKTTGLLVLFQMGALLLVYLFHIKEITTNSLLFGGGLMLSSLLSIALLRRISRGEPYLLLIANLIFSVGVVMIYRLRPDLGERQLLIYFGSLVAFFLGYVILRHTHRFWEGKTWIYYGLTISLFAITLLFGLTKGGAQNWIRIAGVQVQPSEFAKVPFVFFVASWFQEYETFQQSIWKKLSLTIGVYILLGLFLLQRELGTAAVFFAILLTVQVAFERNKWIPAVNLLLAALGLFVAYHLFSHVRVRFDMWLDPWSDFNDKGYQIIQALFAIAEGGFFGTGVGMGQPGRIPLGYSDFIFASIIEEMGMFMGICLTMLFILLLYRGFKIAMQQERDFYATMAVAVSVLFASQAFIMFAGVMKVIPLTGITVPFLTYGGSSLLSSFILLASLQTCSENLLIGEVLHETK